MIFGLSWIFKRYFHLLNTSFLPPISHLPQVRTCPPRRGPGQRGGESECWGVGDSLKWKISNFRSCQVSKFPNSKCQLSSFLKNNNYISCFLEYMDPIFKISEKVPDLQDLSAPIASLNSKNWFPTFEGFQQYYLNDSGLFLELFGNIWCLQR